MLTYQDCIGLSDLTEEEIKAIAEHEHVPDIIALEFGHYLIETGDGVPAIKAIIIDDIKHAEKNGDINHVIKLKIVLQHFIDTHPDNLV